MPEETLFTAARRALRDFNIDMNKGGLITRETEKSMNLLLQQVQQEESRLKSLRHPTVVGDKD